MRTNRFLALALLSCSISLVGCAAEQTSTGNAASELDPPEDCECVPVEDIEIGTIGLVVDVGGLDVTFTRWIEKPGAPGKFVGFEAEAEGGVPAFYVNAGGAKFVSAGDGWVHPAGASSAAAFGIKSVDVCDTHPEEEEEDEPIIP